MKKAVAVLCAAALAAAASSAQGISAAIGYSEKADPLEAGREAADIASAKLASKDSVRIVLVFDHASDKRRMLEGIAQVFPEELICGCSAYAPLAAAGNDGLAAVCALAGDFSVHTALAGIEGGHFAAGKTIAETLKPCVNTAQENLLLLLGDCHVPANDELARGAQSVLGEMFPMAGAAASSGQLVYHKGRIHEKSDMGILLSGAFSLSFARKHAQSLDAILVTASDALWEAAGTLAEKPLLAFVFNCGGRLGALGEEKSRELALLREPGVPFAGFYGSGETAPEHNGAPARGGGFQIAVCALAPGLGKTAAFDPTAADIAELAAALSSPDSFAARSAAKKLKQCGARAASALDALAAAAAGADPLLAAYAAEAVAAIAPEKAPPLLKSAIQSSEPRLRITALQCGRRLGPGPAADLKAAARRLLADADTGLAERLEAIRLFGSLGDESPETAAALAACAKNALPDMPFPMMKSLVETCAKLPPAPAMLELYLAAIKNIYPVGGTDGWLYNAERSATRVAAARALARLGKNAAPAMPAIEEAINLALFTPAAAKPADKDGETVKTLIALLGELGEEAAEQMPLLEKIFESKDVPRDIKGLAWDAMQKIEPQAPAPASDFSF